MPSPVNPLSFFHAAATVPRAWGFIWRHKRLWPLAAMPFLLNLAVFVLAFWLSYTYLGGWIRSLLPGGEGWWWAALLYVVLVLVVLALLALEIYLFAVVGRIVSEPFLELLTRRTEALASGMPPGADWADSGLMRDVLRVIRQSLMRLLIYLAVMLPLLLINLIPGLGGAIYAVLAWLVTAYFLALEFMDYPLDRRGLSLKQKGRYVRGLGLGWLGYGSSVLALGLIPVVNFAFLPLAAVGGTLLYLERPLPRD
ncbi:MAG: EI24 domain-containing protein [Desulfarculaceae bacterium]|nr:EI24 domain-containing protein [Desulfarculaceae bacterium]MCF8074407.1 EI24 domain-containing protein [Desulfarculaceae bacterium]MCF8103617.1 EI24 domain-containing protein [Desulfarculaceae bacterium]MCF8116030.1 EI24 domain-containing protein [Desulfarculaceae bacterium]